MLHCVAEKNKAGKVWYEILGSAVREDLPGKVAFESRPEELREYDSI